MAKETACVLASGGFDSSVLVADLLRQGRPVQPVFVRSGFIWEDAEENCLRRLLGVLRGPGLRRLAVLEAPMGTVLAGHWSMTGRGVPSAAAPWDSVFLPGRNLILLSLAGVYCRARKISTAALGVLKGNPFSDATPDFVGKLEHALALGLGGRVRLRLPYRGLTKAQVARRVPGFPAHLTFSCLRPRGARPCGRCGKCSERRLGLA